MGKVQIKEAGKPGYMTTEFWATVGVIAWAVLQRAGVTPDQAQKLAENWLDSLLNYISTGQGNIGLIVVGFLVWGYQKRRAEVKKAQLDKDAKVESILMEKKDFKD